MENLVESKNNGVKGWAITFKVESSADYKTNLFNAMLTALKDYQNISMVYGSQQTDYKNKLLNVIQSCAEQLKIEDN